MAIAGAKEPWRTVSGREERAGGGKEASEVKTETLRRGGIGGKQFGKINRETGGNPGGEKSHDRGRKNGVVEFCSEHKVVGTGEKAPRNKQTARPFCPNDRR